MEENPRCDKQILENMVTKTTNKKVNGVYDIVLYPDKYKFEEVKYPIYIKYNKTKLFFYLAIIMMNIGMVYSIKFGSITLGTLPNLIGSLLFIASADCMFLDHHISKKERYESVERFTFDFVLFLVFLMLSTFIRGIEFNLFAFLLLINMSYLVVFKTKLYGK